MNATKDESLEPELDPRVNEHVRDQQEVMEAVSLGGRPTLYQPRFCTEVRRLALLGVANTDRQIASFFGVSVSTIYNWKGQFPEFLEAITRAKAVAYCVVADKLFEKTTGYEWVGGPRPKSVQADYVSWGESIDAASSPVSVSANNPAGLRRDSVMTFLAGAFVGIAGGGLIGAVQEAMHAKGLGAPVP